MLCGSRGDERRGAWNWPHVRGYRSTRLLCVPPHPLRPPPYRRTTQLCISCCLVCVVAAVRWSVSAGADAKLDDDAAAALAAVLRGSSNIVHVDLLGNDIGKEGCTALAAVLKTNATIHTLILDSESRGHSPVVCLCVTVAVAVDIAVGVAFCVYVWVCVGESGCVSLCGLCVCVACAWRVHVCVCACVLSR
jgi:hypothetical protein